MADLSMNRNQLARVAWLAGVLLVISSVASCTKKATDGANVPPTTGAVGATGPGSGGPAPAGGLSCAVCEMKGANVDKLCPNVSMTKFLGTTDPAKFGCNGFPPADQVKCNALLACLRGKGCGRGDNPMPCLCGDMDPQTCASKPITSLPGACRDLYISAANGGDVYTLFFLTDSTIGVANNLFACDADAKCSCP